MNIQEIKEEIELRLENLKEDTFVRDDETTPEWDLNNFDNWEEMNNQVIRLCSLFQDTFELIEKMKNNQIFQDRNYLSTNLENDENFELNTMYHLEIDSSRNGNYNLVNYSTNEVVCEFQNNDRVE